MLKTTLKIEGMMCAMCEAHICETIRKAVPNAKKVSASKTKKEAAFLTEEAVDAEALSAAINATGYTCTGVNVSAFEKRAGLAERKEGADAMKRQRDQEDYLKTILNLERKKGYVRSMDVAEYMNVSKPSVCYAVRRLQESGLLRMDAEKLLHLTPAGRASAEHIQERYKIIKEGLVSLGVDPEIAERDACQVEHVISPETFEKIKAFWEHQVSQEA